MISTLEDLQNVITSGTRPGSMRMVPDYLDNQTDMDTLTPESVNSFYKSLFGTEKQDFWDEIVSYYGRRQGGNTDPHYDIAQWVDLAPRDKSGRVRGGFGQATIRCHNVNAAHPALVRAFSKGNSDIATLARTFLSNSQGGQRRTIMGTVSSLDNEHQIMFSVAVGDRLRTNAILNKNASDELESLTVTDNVTAKDIAMFAFKMKALGWKAAAVTQMVCDIPGIVSSETLDGPTSIHGMIWLSQIGQNVNKASR